MGEWEKKTIGDLCETVSITYRCNDPEVILINTSDILEGKILNHKKVKNEGLKGQFKKTFQKNDILYSEIRPANKRFAFVDFDDTSLYIASTKLMVLRPKSEIVYPQFLFAILKDGSMLEKLQHLAETRSGTFPQITFSSELAPMLVMLPDLDTQKKIVSVLNFIEDKIELNNTINKNLEEQAVTLFKQLLENGDSFIESAIGTFPSDFKVTKVGQIPMLVTDYVANGSFASLKANVTLFQEPNFAYFVRNTDLKSDLYNVYVDNHSYEFLAKSKLFGGEIIISNVGDVGSVFLCPLLNKPMTLGNNIIMLRPDDEKLRLYLYIWFKHAQGQALIQGIKGGSAQPKFNKTDFKNLLIAIPSKMKLSAFNETVSPIFKAIDSNLTENKNLISLRDTLLPKLMSGEIDVSNIDI